MEENLANMVAALRQIQDDGGDGNFVVFTADPMKNYYILFIGELAEDNLFGEAVSNEFLDWPNELTPAQENRLRALGWQDGEANFFQEWSAHDDEDREEIAHVIMQTFQDVYNIPSSQDIEITINLWE
jgi:hypothetical protein